MNKKKAKSVRLFEEDITDYDGSGRFYIVDGNELDTEFLVLPLGLFMPDTMMRFDWNGGTAWGTEDKRNYITLISTPASADLPTITGANESLTKYKEYMGSFRDGDGTVDLFSFVAKGKPYLAEVRTSADAREQMLPLFTDMISDIQVLEKREPLIGGVFVKVPEILLFIHRL
ncbi:hypothetical protein PaeBR_13195 [Paenibacillus sp. BR2-3]|uniref:hypothetical protein n=1 Tax=Paenibacillus sp. BR2-3 TaxID=3048494 RepID=UPI0039779AE3